MNEQRDASPEAATEMTAKEWAAYLNDHPEEDDPFSIAWRLWYAALPLSEENAAKLLAAEHERIATCDKAPEERERLHRRLEAFRKRVEAHKQAIIRLTDEGVIPHIVGRRGKANARQSMKSAPASNGHYKRRRAERQKFSAALKRRGEEAADYLGVSVRLVDKLLASGELPKVKVGGATGILISDLDAYLRRDRHEQARER